MTTRKLGGTWILDHLWGELGVKEVLVKLLEARDFRTPAERLLLAMVANRALAPLAIEERVEHDAAIPGLDSLSVQQLYRAMDFLVEASEEIQREIYFSVANLLNLEVDLLYLDTTSSYFKIDLPDDSEETLRTYGHS